MFQNIRPRPHVSDIFGNGDFFSVLAFRPHVNGVFEHRTRQEVLEYAL